MNADLENELSEMGPEYRKVVDRLLGSCELPARETHVGKLRFARPAFAYLTAASLLVLFGMTIFLREGDRHVVERVRVMDVRSEYMLAAIRSDEAVKEIIRTQNPDGSWRNEFLTRQNAAALRLCGSEDAKIAYKKAMRNLRSKGVL